MYKLLAILYALSFFIYCIAAATGSKVEGEEQNSVDASLVVTLEINNTVYQGVLFARPQSASSPQR